MQHVLLTTLLLLSSFRLNAQLLHLSDANNIYRLNLNTCIMETVVEVSDPVHINDIAFHPNDNLYGISSDGKLFEIDTLSGTIQVVHFFEAPNQAFKALTTDAEGIFYTSGSQNVLFAYDLINDVETDFGVIEFGAAGDMSFYKGELYMSTKGPMAQINLNNLDSSFASHDFPVMNDFTGLVTVPINCSESSIYGIESRLGESGIYLLDFNFETAQEVCTVNFTLTGAAASTEFLSSFGLKIRDFLIAPVTCGASNGSIEVIIDGGLGQVFYALDNATPILQNRFENLQSGAYQINITDDWGCEIFETVEVPLLKCPVFIPNIFSPNNDGFNDVFRVYTPDVSKATVLSFQVFNRWGALLYEDFNFPIVSSSNWWDGTYEGESLDRGVFVYLIEIEFENGERELFQGEFISIY